MCFLRGADCIFIYNSSGSKTLLPHREGPGSMSDFSIACSLIKHRDNFISTCCLIEGMQ
jgi:hypothetical protein